MNTEQSPQQTCPKCGATLAADTVEGLCPACLLALNLATQTELPEDVGPNGTRKVPPPPKSPPTPQQIAGHFPQFEILECLGRGGMGVVYKARQKSLDRLVALKILAPERERDPQFAERFAREAKTLAQLGHPSIVTIHDFGEADGMFYLVMEFVDGVNLRQLLKERKLSPEEALAIVPPVCEALQYAHGQGVIHRDIKPENLLLDKQGRIKIADFGIAKILGRERGCPGRSGDEGAENFGKPGNPPAGGSAAAGTAALRGDFTSEQVIGTPQYMAPEQTSSPQKVDHRADIYSLGVVLYEMLTGELPASKLQPPSKKVQVDVRIDEIVLRALEKEPERRYQTATQFRTVVETMAESFPRSSGRESAPSKPPGHSGSESGLTSAATRQEPRFSRTAIAGACWAPLFIGGFAGFLPWGFLVVPLICLGATAPFGTTLLGWAAVSQIRRAAGKLNGMRLAVFDGLVFPLLGLDGLICGGWYSVWSWDWGVTESSVWVAVASVISCCIVDLFIIRRVWRAVNVPLGNSDTPGVTGKSLNPPRRWLKIVPAVLLLLVVGLALLVVQTTRRHHAEQVWEQRSYVRQKLSQSTDLKLTKLGYDGTWSKTTVTDDLSQAWRETGPMRKRMMGGRSEAITNASLRYCYLGDGLWNVIGAEQLDGIRFEISTLEEMAHGPLPVPPPPTTKPFDDLGLPYPQLSVIEDATGQPQSFPNPLALAEAVTKGGDFESWRQRMSPSGSTNILGYSFGVAFETSADKPYNAVALLGGLALKRPDGSLLATVSDFDRDWRKAEISVYDETGSNVTARVSVERAAADQPFRITQVR